MKKTTAPRSFLEFKSFILALKSISANKGSEKRPEGKFEEKAEAPAVKGSTPSPALQPAKLETKPSVTAQAAPAPKVGIFRQKTALVFYISFS